MSMVLTSCPAFPKQWSGQVFTTGRIAIDCETTLARYPETPTLVLTAVSDGHETFIIREVSELAGFLGEHCDHDFIAHNCAFDSSVIVKALGSQADVWWRIVDSGKLRDTMLCDALLRLAEVDGFPRGRDLGTVARDYLNRDDVHKDDPYRLRYQELLSVDDWSDADPAFFDYAAKDAEVTAQIWDALVERMRSFGQGKWGWLTDKLQVKAAIALSEIERRGIRVDVEACGSMAAVFRQSLRSLAEQMEHLARDQGFDIFKRDKMTRELILSPTGKPARSTKLLTQLVELITADLDINPEFAEKTGKLSLNKDFWSRYRDAHPFIAAWQDFEEAATLTKFFSGLTTERVHPRYNVLVRNGRTSCSGPNVQQLPRRSGFRELFVPSESHYLLGIDYSALELRALAVVCLKRYGFSKLAELFRNSIDPHIYAAQKVLNLSASEWGTLVSAEQKSHRQKAKAVNFGLSGGLGPQSLARYARSPYGIEMSVDEARELRTTFTNQIFPELGEYLREDTAAIVADNMDCRVADVEQALPGALLGSFGKLLRGNPVSCDGTPYSDEFIDRLWSSVEGVNENFFLLPDICQRNTGPEVFRSFFGQSIATLTGRVRNNVSYAQYRNTAFSGLAADGTKLAMYRLIRAGFKVCAFIHDEFLIEIPVETNHRRAALKIERICRTAMLEIFESDVPVECEYWMSDKWRKDAQAVWDDDGKLHPWIPEPKSDQAL